KPNHRSDITSSFERKVAALAAHKSQIGDIAGLEPMLRQWMAANATEAGMSEGRLAEDFHIVRTACTATGAKAGTNRFLLPRPARSGPLPALSARKGRRSFDPAHNLRWYGHQPCEGAP